jgi:hypothetical protein
MSAVQVSRRISAGGVMLEADITVPEGAHGIVLFAHGSGSGGARATATSPTNCAEPAWAPSWPTCSPPKKSGSTR